MDYDILGGIVPSGMAAPVPLSRPLRPRSDSRGEQLRTGFSLTVGASYPRRAWHPMLLAEVLVGEFGASGWAQSIVLDSFPHASEDLLREIEYLVERSAERGEMMAELAAQADDFTPYFADLLHATPTSHPETWLLISTGLLVGRLVAMHFKHKFNRPRPVQIYPALMPPLLTPPHPSYPNAHALQANLMAECVSLACPGMAEPLRALADRIGENREIAGVHYPSDREASLALVPQVMALLMAGPLFAAALRGAAAEWITLAAQGGPTLGVDPPSPY